MTISLISTTLSTNWDVSNQTNKNTGTVSWNAGDIITVWGYTGDNGDTLTAPTATGLTFTNRLTSAVSGRIKLYLWTATPATSGSSTVNGTISSSGMGGYAVKVYRGTGTLSLGTVSSLGSSTTGTPQVTYTVGATGSVIDGAWGNWNQNSSARTYRTTNLGTATEDIYLDNATFATVGGWHNASTTATGSQTVGLSAPTMNAWLCACIEIEESGGGGSTTSVTVSASCASTATVTRQVQLVRVTSAAAGAVVARQTQRVLSAASTVSAVVVGQSRRILSAAASCSATVASLKARFLELDAVAGATATRVVQAQRIVSGSAASSGVVVRRAQRTISAACASTATAATLKVLLLTVSALAACSATASRIASHVLTLAATAAATAALRRDVRRTVLTSAGSVGSVTAVGPGGGSSAAPGQRPTLGVG